MAFIELAMRSLFALKVNTLNSELLLLSVASLRRSWSSNSSFRLSTWSLAATIEKASPVSKLLAITPAVFLQVNALVIRAYFASKFVNNSFVKLLRHQMETLSCITTLLPMCGFIAQLVKHRTGISRRSRGSNPVEALIFFSGFFIPIA